MRYEELTIDNGYRLDLRVEHAVVVQVKAVPAIVPFPGSQVLSYLRLGGVKLRYLLTFNFDVARICSRIYRIMNGLWPLGVLCEACATFVTRFLYEDKNE